MADKHTQTPDSSKLSDLTAKLEQEKAAEQTLTMIEGMFKAQEMALTLSGHPNPAVQAYRDLGAEILLTPNEQEQNQQITALNEAFKKTPQFRPDTFKDEKEALEKAQAAAKSKKKQEVEDEKLKRRILGQNARRPSENVVKVTDDTLKDGTATTSVGIDYMGTGDTPFKTSPSPTSKTTLDLDGIQVTVHSSGLHRSMEMHLCKEPTKAQMDRFNRAQQTAQNYGKGSYNLFSHNCVGAVAETLHVLDPTLQLANTRMPWSLDLTVSQQLQAQQNKSMHADAKPGSSRQSWIAEGGATRQASGYTSEAYKTPTLKPESSKVEEQRSSFDPKPSPLPKS